MKLKKAPAHPINWESTNESASESELNEIDQSVYRAFKTGDKQAFTVIYDTYWYRLFLVAYRRLHHKEISEELVQNIFVRLWKKKEEVEVHQLENYLFTAIRYEVISYIRTQVVHEKYLAYYQAHMPLQVSQTEDQFALEELNNAIEKGMSTLSEKTRHVFHLSRFENLTIPQIAHHLHLSEKAVEYHLTKSLKFLKSYLKEFIMLLLMLK